MSARCEGFGPFQNERLQAWQDELLAVEEQEFALAVIGGPLRVLLRVFFQSHAFLDVASQVSERDDRVVSRVGGPLQPLQDIVREQPVPVLLVFEGPLARSASRQHLDHGLARKPRQR